MKTVQPLTTRTLVMKHKRNKNTSSEVHIDDVAFRLRTMAQRQTHTKCIQQLFLGQSIKRFTHNSTNIEPQVNKYEDIYV